MLHRAIANAAGALMLAGCSVVGIRSGYEEPDFTVVDRIGDDVEIRNYPLRLAAETTVDAAGDRSGRNQAFRVLFEYISGENKSQSEVEMTTPVEVASTAEEIAMTVPVETAAPADGPLTMRFFLPAGYTPSSAPKPTDPRVRLVELPSTTEAVLRFSGWGGDTTVGDKTDQLREALSGSDWTVVGEPTTLFYDPPWTLPFFRRNEVAMPVEHENASADGNPGS